MLSPCRFGPLRPNVRCSALLVRHASPLREIRSRSLQLPSLIVLHRFLSLRLFRFSNLRLRMLRFLSPRLSQT
jgi:hypothetical protein